MHEHATLAADLARVAEVLADRANTRDTLSEETSAGIAFCVNGILSLFSVKYDSASWAESQEMYVWLYSKRRDP